MKGAARKPNAPDSSNSSSDTAAAAAAAATMQDVSFSETVDVDDLMEGNHCVDNHSSKYYDNSADDDEVEQQSLLLAVTGLQAQVSRLEALQGLPPSSPTSSSNSGPVPSLMARSEQAQSSNASGGKSVAFSSDEDSHEDSQEDSQADSHSEASGGSGSSAAPLSRRSASRSRSSKSKRRQRAFHSQLSTSQLDREDGMLDQHLSEDTFGFLLATPTCSAPFGVAVAVVLFQLAIYILMATNLLNRDDPSNLFGIPANVTDAVWIAQIIAIIIAVVLQDDIRTGLDMLREGYSAEMRAAFPFSNTAKFACSVTTRFVEGSLGLIVNFLLIVTSETVIDLLLNFTALAFVSQLDEAAFFLSKQGFAGRKCLEHSTIISEAHYAVPKTMVQARKAIMMVSILIIMMVAWVIVRYNQTSGAYLCNTLLIQMGDDLRPELGTFSGLYDLKQPSKVSPRSQHVTYLDREAGNTRFAFCEEEQYWTVQWKDSPDGDFPGSACDGWQVRSSQTNTFDLTREASDLWFVRDEFRRELILEPFFLICFDCGNTLNAGSHEHCTGRGTCSNAVCTCDEGWYGLRCEFLAPCPSLFIDARTEGTLGRAATTLVLELDNGLGLLMDYKTIPMQPSLVEAYDRPIYIGHLLHGHHMVQFFSGRRWATTHTGLLPLNQTRILLGEESGREEVLNFFLNDFHGHWSTYAVEFLSEPMNLGTPSSQNSPEGLRWFEAETKAHANDTVIQAVNEARPLGTSTICATCHDKFNPCHFDGVCVNTTCNCAMGARGSLCEKLPVGNGRCDAFYNIPYFELDAGDCCDSTCVSSPEFTCGEELNGYVNQGYFHCQLPPNRWQILHDTHIDGDPLSLAGYSVALSQSGTLLAVGEPAQSRVKLFDKDGSLWILRETLQGIPDSHFGVSVALSGGPVHWRNNPNFRAPLILAVGVAKKGEAMYVEIFKCGNAQKCNQVDQLDDVHGKIGPEAYDISNDGRVLAFGFANTGRVEVFEISGDDFEGNRTLRQTIVPVEGGLESAVFGVRLSEHGDVLAVSEWLSAPRRSIVRVYKWDGRSYNIRGDTLFELLEGEILQRQLALSDNGDVLAVGISECPKLKIPVFAWDSVGSTWIPRPSPSLPQEQCLETFLAWSVALDHDGRSLFVSAYPESDLVTAYEWGATTWKNLGGPIESQLPGSESAIAVSSDGAHLVVGLPFAGVNEAGMVSTYSLPLSHCPTGSTHHFRLSLTTDYDPQNTLWSLEDVGTGEIVMTAGPYRFNVATLVEEVCLDTSVCHAFTIYNTLGPFGMQRPGRYDLFLDGEDLDRESFKGHAKRVFVGDSCLACANELRLLRMMVRTCHDAEWQLLDDVGSQVVVGKSSSTAPCGGIENYYWEETCIDESRCYTFTATDTTPPAQASRGVDYVLLYDDDVQVTAEKDVLTFSSSQAGNCPGLVIESELPDDEDGRGG